MNRFTQTWEAGRLTLAGAAGIGVNRARIAVCCNGNWRFPFEGRTSVSSHTDWEDAAGTGVCINLAVSGREDGLAVQLHCVIYGDRPMARMWCTLRNESDQGIRLDTIHLLETAATEGGAEFPGERAQPPPGRPPRHSPRPCRPGPTRRRAPGRPPAPPSLLVHIETCPLAL